MVTTALNVSANQYNYKFILMKEVTVKAVASFSFYDYIILGKCELNHIIVDLIVLY